MSQRKRGALIVGAGGIAHAHARAYREEALSERAAAAGVVDIERQKAAAFAQEHGIEWHGSDFAAAIAELAPDVVHICTPPSLHFGQITAALRAGASVLSEKPLCASLAELDEIQRIEQESGRFCAVAFQWRCGSGMRHVKRQMERRSLGRPLAALCNTLWYRDDDYYAVAWRGTWRSELGGPTMGLGIHAMDAFLWLLGAWTEVKATAETVARDIEVEDLSAAIVRFASGAIATIMNSALSPRQETYLRIDCERGTVEASGLYSVSNRDWRWTAVAEPGRPQVTVHGDSGNAGATAGEAGDAGAGDGTAAAWAAIPEETPADHTTLITELHDDIDAGRRPMTSGAEARRTLEFLSALYKSAATGRSVRPGEIKEGDRFYTSVNGH